MTFEELWSQVNGLPNTAKEQVPGILSASTRKRLAKHTPKEVSVIITDAINAVNHGSTVPLDELVQRRL